MADVYTLPSTFLRSAQFVSDRLSLLQLHQLKVKGRVLAITLLESWLMILYLTRCSRDSKIWSFHHWRIAMICFSLLYDESFQMLLFSLWKDIIHMFKNQFITHCILIHQRNVIIYVWMPWNLIRSTIPSIRHFNKWNLCRCKRILFLKNKEYILPKIATAVATIFSRIIIII